MSADGKIASPQGKQIRISSEEDIERMYKLRNEFDAVLVGINTVLSDDPKLTVKEKYVEKPHQPIRIVLDSKCKTPIDSQVVNKNTKTIIATTTKNCNKKYPKNVEIIQLKKNKEGLIDLKQLLEILKNRDIDKLMVEGGSTVIWNFIKEKLVDDLYIYIRPMIIGGKNTPSLTHGEGFKNQKEYVNMEIVETYRLGNGLLVHYRLIK